MGCDVWCKLTVTDHYSKHRELCVCVWVCVCVCECVFLGRGTALVTLLVYLQFEQEVRLTGELVLGGMTNTCTRSNTVDVLCHTQMRS